MPTRGGTVVEIKRQKPVVAAYHYDQPNAEQNVETQLQVGFTPLNTDDQTYPKENSIIRCILDFRLVFEEYVISGRVSQINHVINRKIESQVDVTEEEVNEIVAPLFDILKRMTYEVTEIATDEPGLTLNFQSEA